MKRTCPICHIPLIAGTEHRDVEDCLSAARGMAQIKRTENARLRAEVAQLKKTVAGFAYRREKHRERKFIQSLAPRMDALEDLHRRMEQRLRFLVAEFPALDARLAALEARRDSGGPPPALRLNLSQPGAKFEQRGGAAA